MAKNVLPPLPMLPMQLMLNLGTWANSPSAYACASSALPHWNPLLNDPKALQNAIQKEAKDRATSLLSGILRYSEVPYERKIDQKPVIWQRGNTRLLDYGNYNGSPLGGERLRASAKHEARSVRGKSAKHTPHDSASPRQLPPKGGVALFVPSLINRYYILDLDKERSMLRWLAAEGVHPLVLDWGKPGAHEKDFGCEEYITDILLPAIEFIYQSSGRPVTLAGYCMGGVLSVAAAQLKPKQVGALALFATPWDFHCKEFAPFIVDGAWQRQIAEWISAQKTLSAEIIQSLFYMTDPFVFEQKFRRFAEINPNSAAAAEFVALERWVNDGVPMTSALAKDCLIGWVQQNKLVTGNWKLENKTIDPKKIKIPTFIAMPKNDHVVPYDCAAPLAKALPHAEIIHPGSGHVGMIVGGNAKKELWQPLAKWLKA